MAYKLTHGTMIVRMADNAFIPPDPANRDYAEFLAWQEEGNTPEPADPLPPEAASRVRLPKLTLVDRLDKAGKLDAALAALGTGKQRIRWDASNAVDPANPDVRALLTAVVGADQVDVFLAPETPAEAAI